MGSLGEDGNPQTQSTKSLNVKICWHVPSTLSFLVPFKMGSVMSSCQKFRGAAHNKNGDVDGMCKWGPSLTRSANDGDCHKLIGSTMKVFRWPCELQLPPNVFENLTYICELYTVSSV